MTTTERILEVLSDGEWWLGVDMVKADPKLPKWGGVYSYLYHMEDRGEVESREEESAPAYTHGIKRRQYRITAKGRRARAPKKAGRCRARQGQPPDGASGSGASRRGQVRSGELWRGGALRRPFS